MAVGLRFTDGTTTVTVSSSSVGYVLSYKQGSSARSKPDVTDKVEVLLVSNLSTVQGTVRDLNRLFRQAEERQKTSMGVRVYVERDLGDSTWWRSEIVEGVPLSDDRTFDLGLASGKMSLELIFTRKNYWEGSEVQVPLSNGNGTNNTSGLTVYNHDDAGTGHDNWVSIAAASVAGDMPGPARLEMTNSYATRNLHEIWIGQNWTDPANHVSFYEAEDATGGTDVADTSCSGGYYSEYSLISGSEMDMYTWAVSTAMINAARGGMFRGLLRWWSYLQMVNIWFRLKVKWSTQTVWQSERVRPSSIMGNNIRDLFSIRMPPWLAEVTNLAGFSLILSGYQITGSPITVKLDYLTLMPADGWRALGPSAWCPTNYRVIDDAITGNIYVDDGSGTNKIGTYQGYGQQIHLEPNKLQRLYFQMTSDTSGYSEIDRSISVKVYYRLRRFTL